MANKNNKKKTDDEKSLVKREGPLVQEYLLEFLQYLKRRTGFIPDNFRASKEFQRILEDMERAQVPMEIWKAFINAAIRLIAMNDMNIDDTETFLDLLKLVLDVLVQFYMDNLFMQFLGWLLHTIPRKVLEQIICLIYHFLYFSAKKLWEYVEKRLTEYLNFLINNARSCPQSLTYY